MVLFWGSSMSKNVCDMSFERNIGLLYVIGSLMWMRFFIPVLALFYIASRVPIEQFAIIMSAFSFVILIFEVPSGVIADIFGRKNILLISGFMYIIEVCILAFCDGFYLFLIAKIISGIGVSLSSGTNSALLYETLKKLKREDEHKRISGKLITITSISMAFVFVIGSALFDIHYKLPAYVSVPFITFGFILTFFLKEPYEYKQEFKLSRSIEHLKQGVSYFKNHKAIRVISVFSVPIAVLVSILLSMSSVYFVAVGVPIFLIGLVAFIASLLRALGSKKAHLIEAKFGMKKSLLFIQVSVLLSVFLMMLVVPYAGVLFYLLIPLISGFFYVVVNDYMNLHVNETHRATILSIRNMFDNFGIFVLFPLVGFIMKSSSFTYAYGVLLFVLVVGCFVFYFMNKRDGVF